MVAGFDFQQPTCAQGRWYSPPAAALGQQLRQDDPRCRDILGLKFLEGISLCLQAANSSQRVNECMCVLAVSHPSGAQSIATPWGQAPSLLRFSRSPSPVFYYESQQISPFQIPLTSFFSSYHDNFSRVKVSHAGIPHVGA